MSIYDEAIKQEFENGIPLQLTIKTLERAKKEHELLELYRLEKEAKEKYHTSGSLYVMQHVLDELREIAEEIYLKEKELEEVK